ncbi:MAG: NHLP leader peptide family RiPP precursor [Thermoanaerobaculia bacterium]
MSSTTPNSTPASQPMTRKDFEAHIVAKAWRDPKYKQRLLSDPKSVLAEELRAIDPSVQLPANLKVSVHEESPTQYHLVLPRNPNEISLGEVAGDNLEAIAPQTIAVVVLAAVAVNTVGALNNVGAVNAAVTGNVGVNANTIHNANVSSTVNTV